MVDMELLVFDLWVNIGYEKINDELSTQKVRMVKVNESMIYWWHMIEKIL